MRSKNPLITAALSILTILIYGASSLAQTNDDCPNADLRGKNWPTLHERQPGVGWCYAVVESDLISAEIGVPISSISVANSVERSRDTQRQKIYSRIYSLFDANEDIALLHRFNIFGESYEQSFSTLRQSPVCAISILDEMRDSLAVRDVFLDRVFSDLESLRKKNISEFKIKLQNLFDPIQPQFAIELYRRSIENKWIPLIDLAVDLSCRHKLEISNLKIQTQNLLKTSSSDSIQIINQMLVQGKPIGIGYHSKLYSHPEDVDREKANHASIVVGQFFDQKSQSCKFIIRASDKYTCKLVANSIPCKDGHFVVPRDTALKAISDIMWLRR